MVAKQLVTSSFVGEYKSAFKGRGLEFESYREYLPTDDASLIDWGASVRSGGKLLVKQFVEERNLEIFFVIDASATMVFGTQDRLKNEYAAELSASLAYAMLQAGESVGACLFNDNIVESVPPAFGSRQFYILLKTLAHAQNYGGPKRMERAIQFANSTLQQGALLIIVSDFIGFKPEWLTLLKIACRKFDVMGLMVRDPRDLELPQTVGGEILFSDSLGGQKLIVETGHVREAYNKLARQQVEEVRRGFVEAGADLLVLRTDSPFIEPVTKFFSQRAERIMG